MATSDSALSPSDNPAKKPAPKPAPKKKVVKTAAAVAGPTAAEPSLKTLLPAEGEVENPGEQGEPILHHAAGFWNQPWVQNILPLATSLVFHISIIALGILLWKAAPMLINPNKDQIIIPESKSIEKNAMPGGIEHPGLNNDNTRDAAQDVTKETDNQGFSTQASNNVSAASGSSNEASTGFEGVTRATGIGNSTGLGTGGGGGTAPWGVPGGGGGLLPKSNFFGTGGNATKVVYLCDKSGSMLGVFGALKQQLKESINALDVTAGQQFNIIFFADSGADPLFKDGMHIASPDAKKLALEYIDNEVASGGTLPLPAINMAISEKPELLYVLTDGFDNIPSFDDVTNSFKAANAKMHINCIFLQSDEDPKLEQFLKAIADQGHGVFKKVLKSDM